MLLESSKTHTSARAPGAAPVPYTDQSRQGSVSWRCVSLPWLNTQCWSFSEAPVYLDLSSLLSVLSNVHQSLNGSVEFLGVCSCCVHTQIGKENLQKP